MSLQWPSGNRWRVVSNVPGLSRCAWPGLGNAVREG